MHLPAMHLPAMHLPAMHLPAMHLPAIVMRPLPVITPSLKTAKSVHLYTNYIFSVVYIVELWRSQYL
jgi:hypothetical protein